MKSSTGNFFGECQFYEIERILTIEAFPLQMTGASLDFVQEVIALSQNSEGTWRYSFLTDSMTKLADMNQHALRHLITALVDYLLTNPPPLSSFKICQFISFIRYQQPVEVVVSTIVYRQADFEKIMDRFRNCEDERHLMDAAVSLLQSILSKAQIRKDSIDKMRARSTINTLQRDPLNRFLMIPKNMGKKVSEALASSCLTFKKPKTV